MSQMSQISNLETDPIWVPWLCKCFWALADQNPRIPKAPNSWVDQQNPPDMAHVHGETDDLALTIWHHNSQNKPIFRVHSFGTAIAAFGGCFSIVFLLPPMKLGVSPESLVWWLVATFAVPKMVGWHPSRPTISNKNFNDGTSLHMFEELKRFVRFINNLCLVEALLVQPCSNFSRSFNDQKRTFGPLKPPRLDREEQLKNELEAHTSNIGGKQKDSFA